MYSVLQIGACQYRVETGDVVDTQKMDLELGAVVDLDQVLFVKGDKQITVGTPLVKKAKVSAQVVRQEKARKLTVFKRRPGLWQKKKGHRQQYTSLLITKIDDGQGNIKEIDKKSKTYKKYILKQKSTNNTKNADSADNPDKDGA